MYSTSQSVSSAGTMREEPGEILVHKEFTLLTNKPLSGWQEQDDGEWPQQHRHNAAKLTGSGTIKYMYTHCTCCNLNTGATDWLKGKHWTLIGSSNQRESILFSCESDSMQLNYDYRQCRYAGGRYGGLKFHSIEKKILTSIHLKENHKTCVV